LSIDLDVHHENFLPLGMRSTFCLRRHALEATNIQFLSEIVSKLCCDSVTDITLRQRAGCDVAEYCMLLLLFAPVVVHRRRTSLPDEQAKRFISIANLRFEIATFSANVNAT